MTEGIHLSPEQFVLNHFCVYHLTIPFHYPCIGGPSGARGGFFGAGGRFKGGTDPVMEKFNESIHFDKR
jgi:hypothetical protein